MKKNVFVTLIIFVAFISGCKKQSSMVTETTARDEDIAIKLVSLDESIDIKYGESVLIPLEDLTIKFNEIISDSRCPEGVICFWQGTAKIELKISKGSEIQTDTIQTYIPEKIITIGKSNNSYKFLLKNVYPYPKYNTAIDKKDYVITLNVSRYTY